MFFISSFKWNPGHQPAQGLGDEAWDWAPFNKERPTAHEARVHGNPLVDTSTVGWQETTAGKRAENDYYTAVYSGKLEDRLGMPGSTGMRDWFLQAPGWIQGAQGSFYLIDVDDPELVEHGEDYIQERLTSHLADLYLTPESTWEPWVQDAKKYSEAYFFNNLARGYADAGPILSEPIRQRLGPFPYKWMGAPID